MEKQVYLSVSTDPKHSMNTHNALVHSDIQYELVHTSTWYCKILIQTQAKPKLDWIGRMKAKLLCTSFWSRQSSTLRLNPIHPRYYLDVVRGCDNLSLKSNRRFIVCVFITIFTVIFSVTIKYMTTQINERINKNSKLPIEILKVIRLMACLYLPNYHCAMQHASYHVAAVVI